MKAMPPAKPAQNQRARATSRAAAVAATGIQSFGMLPIDGMTARKPNEQYAATESSPPVVPASLRNTAKLRSPPRTPRARCPTRIAISGSKEKTLPSQMDRAPE